MSRTLYDLAASNPELRFSPFCWRAKMALRHKGLDFETIAWRFTEKDIIARTRQGRVPVLVDDERWVHDSWEIALYLDQTYPDRPLLMRDATERAMARFVSSWCDQTLHPIIRSTFLLDIHDLVADRDRAYFRESREKTFGRRLEELAMERAAGLTALAQALQPAEATLNVSHCLAGDAPSYADYCLFGSLQWGHVLSHEPIVSADSAIGRWFERALDLFDGYARQAPTVRGETARRKAG
jgi:glutathione S-transferase